MRNHLKHIFLAAVTLLLAASCKEELDMDFNEVAPFHVIQGDLTETGARVIITRSRSMSDSVKGKCLQGADVRLSDDNGRSETHTYDPRGYYAPASGWKGETGRTYRLDVSVEGNTYSASSFMMPPVSLDSLYFVWLETAGMRMLLLKYHYTFATGREADSIRQGRLCTSQCYMERNGRFYRSHTTRQINPMLFHGEQFIGCMPEKMMEKNEPDDRESILYENDTIHLSLWSTDPTAYEYFKSQKTGQKNAYNPLTNIEGGAQGYFAAHSVATLDTIFRMSEIRTEK